jgi:glycosyltransferase involved in cell wall biosynthesis
MARLSATTGATMQIAENTSARRPRRQCRPLVTICLPVYNGERYLRDAIRSVMEQTLSDLELVISDNASSDGTHSICLEAAAQDWRVKYFPAEVNRGLAWNFNRAFCLATGRYVAWMGHDDLLAPDFVRQCVEAIQASSKVLLCFANADYIDVDGNVIQRVNLTNPGASPTPSKRFNDILWDNRCDPICGVMRAEALRQTRLHLPYADSDRVLLAELGLRGQFHHLPGHLFSRRMHPSQTTAKHPDRWARTLVFDPSQAGKVSCPWWHEAIDLIRAIRHAELPVAERWRCYKYLYWWARVHRGFLCEDVLRAFAVTRQRFALLRRIKTWPWEQGRVVE